MLNRSRSVTGAAVLLLLAAALWGVPARRAPAAGFTSDSGHAEAQPVPRWYSASSPWNTPIQSGTPALPKSPAWMASLRDSVAQLNVNQSAWTPTISVAGASTRRQRVTLANGWILDEVPIPISLAPSPDSDGHAVIMDMTRGREYDFFRLARTRAGKWRALSGVVLRINGSGWYDGRFCSRGVCGPWGARASSAALAGGLIRPSEARDGVIEHALACSIPGGLIGPSVTPATTSDGIGGATAMPMGSRLQLDPEVDISTLGLEPGEEMIARALQTFGAYVVDSSSAFALHAQNSSALSADNYPPSWANGLSKELLEHVRVVASPPRPRYDNHAVFSQPHR